MRLETLDARVKLFVLLALSTVSVLTKDAVLLALLLALTAALLLLGGVHLGRALWRVRGALGLLAALFVLQCIFNRSGDALISVSGFVLIRKGGLLTGFLVAVRLLIVLLSALIVLTGEKRDYILALTQIGLPYEIGFMVMAGLHFLPLLRDEARDVMNAVQMRGTKVSGTGLRNRLQIYLRIALPVVAGAIRRSEQLSVAMETQAFRAMPRRTTMRRLQMTKRDWLYLAGFAVVMVLLIGGVKLWRFL